MSAKALLYFRDLRTRTLFRLILRDCGVEVVALSPEDVSFWSGTDVELVVTDLSASELKTHIRWMQNLRGVDGQRALIIVYAPGARETSKQDFKTLGASGTIAQPFHEAAFSVMMRKLLAARAPKKQSRNDSDIFQKTTV